MTPRELIQVCVSVISSVAVIAGLSWALIRPAASDFVRKQIEDAGLAKLHLVGNVEEKIKNIEKHIEKQEERDEKQTETLNQLKLDVQKGLITQETILHLLKQRKENDQ